MVCLYYGLDTNLNTFYLLFLALKCLVKTINEMKLSGIFTGTVHNF